MKSKLEQFKEIENALDVLKGDFESQLEYIKEIRENNGNRGLQHLVDNLGYLILDNSSEARLRAIAVLKSFADDIVLDNIMREIEK